MRYNYSLNCTNFYNNGNRKFIKRAISVEINELAINREVDKIIIESNAVNEEDKILLLLSAITHIDLTSLKGDETFADIKNLCAKAAKATDINFGWHKPIRTAAVCIFPASACDAIQSLKELNVRDQVKVVSVAGDFPDAKLDLQTRIKEIKQVVNYGVDEVDIVINRKLAIDGQWHELYNELKLMREACGKIKMKTILATGDLPCLKTVYIASIVAMLAGSDFIKTSTGKEIINATLPVGIVMSKAIKDYHTSTGLKIGFKPAGGIKTVDDTIQWIVLVKEELGSSWLTKDLFRIGASSVLDNINKCVEILKF
ncbi:PREDICTED: deoxyribose-phosphate aldolase [Ceratosolen solmsi marchali]|uniref:deoxyribose-phosphate aldolase n=1 Tax=Ceratosolen solmsi marchali TaxID=326594 RepID=A0AAJ7E0C5_9HYME|nr:PREDICTED: deoxyribose-phosphate aldolase [Ceratosolen solmsi marchali]